MMMNVLVNILTVTLILFDISESQVYDSCDAVTRALGSGAGDGEYPIKISDRLAVPLYCADLNSKPQSYVPLKSGRVNNFGSFYRSVGSAKDCGTAVPSQNNTSWGRTEFLRIKINSISLRIDLNDYKYSHTIGPRQICFGCAGDKFSATPKCPPRGKFKISLAGTPFSVDDSVVWKWTGQFSDGSTTGQANILTTSYIGCFKDGVDRLLPVMVYDSTKLTVSICIQKCKDKGYRYAGVEYSRQCFCGNSHNKYSIRKETECNMKCGGGDKTGRCGGGYRISVYSTRTDQVMEGTCGGYPGSCYPTINGQKDFALQLAKTQPCLKNPCQNEAICVALTEDEFKCSCLPGYVGTLCENLQTIVTSSGSDCPTGLQPEQCSCDKCTGARFDGDVCVASNGKPKTTCRYDDPGHVILFNIQGTASDAYCPVGTEIVGCNYWDNKNIKSGNGQASMDTKSRHCSLKGCTTCKVTARCKKYDCGCENNGICSKVTGTCSCLPGYTGSRCQTFDYCSVYEDKYNKTACKAGDCQAVPSSDIRAFGGDLAGDHCVFPFTFQDNSYSRCVEDNGVGPPFACSTYFDGKNDYIDLGQWSPAPVYTIAAWVKPTKIDKTRRTIIGGVNVCRDFGLYLQNGHFNAFYYPASKAGCTAKLQGASYSVGQWYLVSVSNNGTHMRLDVSGSDSILVPVQHYKILTTTGLRIGGSQCCAGDTFQGNIKAIKIWNRGLLIEEVTMSMKYVNSVNSTMEAMYGGLISHYELGHDVNLPCNGIDHGGGDWEVKNSQELSGIHCNVSRFSVPKGIIALIKPYDGSTGGTFEVYALDVSIEGVLDGTGSGYRGGQAPANPAGNGIQGESYSGQGKASTAGNRGGGGGGAGGNSNSHGYGRPGAGGGYGTKGQAPNKRKNSGSGWSVYGSTYGTPQLDTLYLGSGGGSGGNARYLTKSPKGGRGGNGGGIIGLYASRTVTVTGIINVSGDAGQGDVVSSLGCSTCPKSCTDSKTCQGSSTKSCWDTSGPGGGGSGGSVYISGQLVDVGHDRVWALGGPGGAGGIGGCGGDGGVGRVHVDAQVFKGYVSQEQSAYLQTITSQSTYQDLSIPGQKLIIPQTTVYGNEIYRGCFQDDSKNRHFYHQVGQSKSSQMTPQFCINLCRNSNYRYAAVEYGMECFCDNGFDWNLKTSDDDCNKPCAGDKLQYCGASHRMAIYGPHPMSLAIGYNGVQQQCQPWCVTADADRSDPKWGQCDLSSKTSTSYKIHCQCPAGMMGSNCDQSCQNNTWGLGCRNECNCSLINTAECNSIDGSCHCKPGFMGDKCTSPCTPGSFGENCKGVCSCKEREECSSSDGSCRCQAGWTGNDCKLPCPPTYYGPGCTQKCNCFQGSCSPESGQCNCDPGYKLPFCSEMCDPFNYGPNCMYDCDCSSSGCNRLTGVCSCGPGLTGSKCEKSCSHGTWGDGCKKTCSCDGQGGCDGVTGQCFCKPGFVGIICDLKCSNGKYGQDCLQDCPCVMSQATGCDSVVGTCKCKPGFQGNHCEKPCPVGLYGPSCNQICSCRNKAPCDPVSGQCKCLAGFQGSQCEQACPDSKYGVTCAKTCSTCPPGSVCSKVDGKCICPGGNCGKCPPGYYGDKCKTVCNCLHGDCNSATGSCSCLPGWSGPTCNNKCTADHYGNGCSGVCQCQNGVCDFTDGSCSCSSGFTGDKCDVKCPNNTYGVDCQTPCPYCAHSAGCDPIQGTCICTPGYLGVQCDQPCPPGFYGDGCKTQCKCSTNGSCDNVDGSCVCNPGFTGPLCNQMCVSGTWGPGCVNKCDCPAHSTGCDRIRGQCTCTPGFTGVKCIQSCVQGLWGQDCSNNCQCNSTTSYCSPLDGSCSCHPGYTGSSCGQPCKAGTWGRDCSQTCLCSNQGVCDSVTGRCDCLPGYTGTACDKQCKQDVLWGKNCLNPCNCNGHHCDHRNGICECPAGKKGNHCEQDCEPNYFGFQCAQICQCKNGAPCDVVSGSCRCSVGYSGRYCDQSCPPGRYGEGCKLTCSCLNGATCDQSTGACVCADGFKGSNCSQACTGNTWGANCINRCSPSCPVGCLSDTGDCKCQAWTCLNGGTCRSDGRCQCQDGWSDMYCTTALGQDLVSQPGRFSFSLSGGEIAGIAIGIVAVIIMVAVITGVVLKRRFMATAGEGTQVKYDRSQTVEIDSGLPNATSDGGTGFVNPLTVDPTIASTYTEMKSRVSDDADNTDA